MSLFMRGEDNEGKTKSQALFCIMRRLLNIIYGTVKNGTKYLTETSVARRAVNNPFCCKEKYDILLKKNIRNDSKG